MTESEFNQRVDRVLAQIEQAIEDSGAAVDYETNGGILELEFEDGSKIIVNRQTATREIWVAAKSAGLHFRLQDDIWVNARDGEELFTALGRLASLQAGETIRI